MKPHIANKDCRCEECKEALKDSAAFAARTAASVQLQSEMGLPLNPKAVALAEGAAAFMGKLNSAPLLTAAALRAVANGTSASDELKHITPEQFESWFEGRVATDKVNHPPHYTSHPSGVECIEISQHYNFCIGNVIKYLWRADQKGSPIEDLKKARWYLDREIANREKNTQPQEPDHV